MNNEAAWVLESPELLPEACSSRGLVTATGYSGSRMWFVDNPAVAESNAYARISKLAQELGANTVLIDPTKVVEIIPLDSAREWGHGLTGEAFHCPSGSFGQ